ncbi:hypothetical protein Vadar_007781 [Vaccinium darrowii]|uniref:Uncharacterized protein n=1 Tax=Vaccinium darrowii TaxID=229202 RepID=A0ACB7XPB2_9ERIC|nr:hypothetical protein Vadar_007781 [Vaccinium darrowii]
MRDLKAISKEAHDWLLREPIEHWARCQYSPRAQTSRMVNNISESFNNAIKEVRDKPILTMLEGLRRYVMQRYVERTKFSEKFTSKICPNICKKLEFIKEWAGEYSVIYASPQKFEVSSPLTSFIVDLGMKTCSCRKWDVTGIPCTHVCAAMLKDRVIPKDYISYDYHTETFKASYAYLINPVPDHSTWLRIEYDDIMPPPYRRKTGRPRKLRRRGEDETNNPKQRKRPWIRKKPEVMRCSRCKTVGHNVRSCKAVVPSQFEERESSQPRGVAATRGRALTKGGRPLRRGGKTVAGEERAMTTTGTNHEATEYNAMARGGSPLGVGRGVFRTGKPVQYKIVSQLQNRPRWHVG